MKKKSVFRTTWKDYVAFSRRERRGIYILIFLFLAECAVLFWLHNRTVIRDAEDTDQFRKEAEQFFSKADSSKHPVASSRDSAVKVPAQVQPTPRLFAFNPNNTDSQGWVALGFTTKQAVMIGHYVERGGTFRKKEDLKKIYGLKSSDYERLAPWILLPDSVEKPTNPLSQKISLRKIIRVDLATADSVALLELKGIGPSFAHRIVTYREHLGGFRSLNQLKEVWGVSDSLYESLSSSVYLSDSVSFHKLNLNTGSEEELHRHPYIGYRLAKLITAWRQQHGLFTAVDQVRRLPLVDEEIFRKLAPYLTVE